MDDHVESGGPILRLRDQPLWPLPKEESLKSPMRMWFRTYLLLSAHMWLTRILILSPSKNS